jgi:chromosome segregation ATPase
VSERPEPDIFIRILNKVDQIDGIAADVREIKIVQREHTVTLAEHTRILNEHSRKLAEHDGRFDQLETAVLDLHQDVKQHSRDIAELKGRVA